MTIIDHGLALALGKILDDRRSVRRLQPGSFPANLIDDLCHAASTTPSSYGLQPWRVVVLHERNEEFWQAVCDTITDRLQGDRRDRYLRRAGDMRHGGMTLLIFEDLSASWLQYEESEEIARDHSVQALGMLQLALWLAVTANGLSSAPQHWQEFLEDVALEFVGLPVMGYRLVAFMPVGSSVESPTPRSPGQRRLTTEFA